MDSIYSGLAFFGQAFAILRAVFVTLVAAAMIIYGSYVIWVNWNYLQDPNATVVADSVCENKLCKTNITWKDKNGKSYTSEFSTMNSYKKGDTVVVSYKEDDPQGSAQLDVFPSRVGYFFIGFAILLLLLSWGWVYLVERFKWLAALTGGGEIVGVAAKVI